MEAKLCKRLWPARCFLLEGLWFQLATFLAQARLGEEEEDREWAAQCRSKGDQVSDLDGTICCCCSWAPVKTPPPRPKSLHLAQGLWEMGELC